MSAPLDWAGLAALTEEIVACRRCPRLVDWRERVARERVAPAAAALDREERFPREILWGRAAENAVPVEQMLEQLRTPRHLLGDELRAAQQCSDCWLSRSNPRFLHFRFISNQRLLAIN